MRGSYVAYMRMSIRAIRMNLPNTCGVESDTPENGLMFRNPLHHTTAWCHLPGSIWGFRSMRARKDSSSTPAQREVKTSHDRETLLHECAATQDRVTLAGQHPRRRGQCVRDDIHEDVDNACATTSTRTWTDVREKPTVQHHMEAGVTRGEHDDVLATVRNETAERSDREKDRTSRQAPSEGGELRASRRTPSTTSANERGIAVSRRTPPDTSLEQAGQPETVMAAEDKRPGGNERDDATETRICQVSRRNGLGSREWLWPRAKDARATMPHPSRGQQREEHRVPPRTGMWKSRERHAPPTGEMMIARGARAYGTPTASTPCVREAWNSNPLGTSPAVQKCPPSSTV